MITLTCFVKAKPGMSREDFRRHWTEVHAPLVASFPEVRELTGTYRVHVRLDEDYDRPGAPDHDGVAVHTFPSREDFDAYVQLPLVHEHLGPDNEKFLDPDKTVWLLTDDGQTFI